MQTRLFHFILIYQYFLPRKSRSGSSASSGSESPTRSKLVAERKVEVEKFQSEMEKEMEKRKERIEAWRAERKKKSDTTAGEPSTEQQVISELCFVFLP